MYLESADQCMAYIFERWPRRVLLVLISTRLTGSMLMVIWASDVSAANLRDSYSNRYNEYPVTTRVDTTSIDGSRRHEMAAAISVHSRKIICITDRLPWRL